MRFYCGFVHVSTVITIKNSLFAMMQRSDPFSFTPFARFWLAISIAFDRKNKKKKKNKKRNARADYSFRWFYMSCCGCWKAWNDHIIGATMEIYANSLLYIQIFWHFKWNNFTAGLNRQTNDAEYGKRNL